MTIFVFGFIIVITLVGLTNIFNSLATNMSLRKREFASLESIGMTKKELNSMLRFECIAYVLKSLLISVPTGTLITYVAYTVVNSHDKVNLSYELPIMQILSATIVVFLVVYGIMKLSLNKITKQNIIETIRNENN